MRSIGLVILRSVLFEPANSRCPPSISIAVLSVSLRLSLCDEPPSVKFRVVLSCSFWWCWLLCLIGDSECGVTVMSM
jgi:hypothetical protein